MMTAGMVAAAASELLLEDIDASAVMRLSDGSKWRMSTKAGAAFVKTVGVDRSSPFIVEAAGLHEIRKAQAIHVPDVWAVGTTVNLSLIALEWLDIRRNTDVSDAMFGVQLARLHGATAQRFGWHTDNMLGGSPQPNSWKERWVDFFREQRLGHQLTLAAQRVGRSDVHWLDRGWLLCDYLGELLNEHHPRPSLLHGDLWSGNRGTMPDGRPVIFDPAVYYGDREADIAMTRLFGGFGAAFYSAYEECWPTGAGAGTRSTLYNLYHVLNHFNLFGESYGQQARSMIDGLLSELGH